MRNKYNTIIAQFTDLIKPVRKYVLNSRFLLRYSNPTPLLRRKRLFIGLAVLVFIIIPAVFITLKYARPTIAAWWDDTWGYRKTIAISNSYGSTLTNFQTKALTNVDLSADIAAGKIKSDLGDLRFTDINGKLLPYWIEDTTTSSVDAWVLIPTVPASGTTIYMYYGNPNAVNTGNTAGMTTGGTVTTTSGYRIHSFKNSGTFTPGPVTNILALVVGGGGGGGMDMGGGGGGGGVIYNASLAVTAAPPMPVSVGLGGNGAPAAGTFGQPSGHQYTIRATAGQNSTFGGITALGGGYGGSSYVGYTPDYAKGGNGASGGGSSGYGGDSTTKGLAVGGQGYDGGTGNWYYSGGGGGAGGLGASATNQPNGGIGVENSILGTSYYWGGGGGGASYSLATGGNGGNGGGGGGAVGVTTGGAGLNAGSPGTDGCSNCWANVPGGNAGANTGGGGGGGSHYNANNKGGDGGSGIVIIKYAVPTEPSAGSPANEEKSQAPVAYWKFDEGQGSTANDSTAKYNNGSIGSNTWKTEDNCISGKCLFFSSSDRVTVNNNVNVDLSGDLTISFWVKSNDSTSQRRNPIDKAYYGEFAFTQETDKSISYYHGQDGGSYFGTALIPAGTMQENTWYLITMRRVTSESKVYGYVNGRQVSDTTYAVAPSKKTDNIYIGGGYTGQYYKGFIDDVKVYSYARTAAQIKSDHTSRGSIKGVSVQEGSNIKNNDAFSNGLVGYWKMDEASGNAMDSSGNGNTGTPTGTSVGIGKFGSARIFPGNTNYISTPLTNGSTVTISAWATMTSQGRMMWNRQSSAGPDLWLDNNQIYLNTWDGYANPFCNIPSNANDGNFHHYVTIISPGNTSLYYDGQLCGTAAYRDPTGSFIISSGAGYDWNGSIDDVRVYNRALTPSEVAGLYQWAPGPMAYYKLDEGSGTTSVIDSSGNGNTATMNGLTLSDWVSGKVGKALQFNNSDYLSLNVNSWIRQAESVTISGWYYHTGDTVSAPWGIMTNTAGGDGDGFWWHIKYSGGPLYLRTEDTTHSESDGTGTAFVSTGNWSYITTIIGTNKFDIYVNGVLYWSWTPSSGFSWSDINSDTAYLLLGRSYYNDSTAINGKLDDVKIYNYARTTKQIIEDMNAGHPAGGSTTPVGYWKFDEGQGITANNSISGNGNLTLGKCPSATIYPLWSQNAKFGKSLQFTGLTYPNCHFATASYAAWMNTNETTWTFWMKPASTSQGGYIVNRYFGADTGIAWAIYQNNQNLGLFVSPDGTPGNLQTLYGSSNFIVANQWQHVAITLTPGTGFKIYANGVLKDTIAYTSNLFSNTTNLCVGTDCGVNTPWNGYLDELKIYNSALTEDEIKLDYNQGSAMVLGDSVEDASDDPVAYWKLNEPIYNGTSGEVKDVLGIDNGTSYSPTAASTGKIVGAALNPNIAVSDSSTINITDKLTVEYWFQPSVNVTSMSSIYPIGVFKRNWAVGGYGSHFTKSTGTVNFQWCWVGSCGTVTSTTAFLANNWYHYAATYDGLNARLYINGVQEAYTAIGTPMASSSGYGLSLGQGDFEGKFDEVKIYHYARSAAQIKADAATSTLNPSLPGAPIGEWNFEEGTGGSVNDTSGNGNVGTWSGSGSHWSSGKIGKAGNFNGSDDAISTASLINLEKNHTISAWAKKIGTAETIILGYDGSNYAFDFYNSNKIYYAVTGASIYWDQTWDGGWHYYTISRSDTAVTLYVDGVSKGVKTLGANTDFTMDRIGNARGWYWNGQIDQVRVYSYARTPAQVAYDYNRGAPSGWWKFDECQGTVANDSSGNGGTGTIAIGSGGTNTSPGTCTGSSGQAWKDGVTGKYNSSLEFDGSDDNVTIPVTATNGQDIKGPISYTVWFKRSDSGTYQTLVSKIDSCGGSINGYFLRFDGTDQLIFYGWKTTNVFSAPYTSSTMSDGNWHHAVATWDGTTNTNGVKLYIDGTLVSETTSSADNFTSLVGYNQRIGSLSCDAHYFNGRIDDVRVYNYALTPTQIKQVYNNGAVTFGPATGSP